MAKNDIYKVTLTNWAEHNPGAKKQYKKTLIPNNFLSNAKVCSLPLSIQRLLLGLILTCGDHANDTITVTERQVNDMLTAHVGASNALHRLQSLQLVTFEKIESLLIEGKRKEEKRREVAKPAGGVAAFAPTTTRQIGSPQSRVIARYCENFKQRYGTNPAILGSDTGRLGRLAKELGEKKALSLVDAYFAMPDAWVTKSRHHVGLLVTKVNEIKVFAETGSFVTMADVRDADKNLRAVQEQASLLSDPEFQKGFDAPVPRIAGGFE